MNAPDFTKPNAPFDEWKSTLPKTHWAKYDLSACRLGWEAAMATVRTFEKLKSEYLEWFRTQFPDETVAQQIVHLKEEFKELTDDPNKADEYADVLMLLLCVAEGSGVDIVEAFRTKFEINKARKWEKTERGYRHVRASASSAEG